ncbi:MAG: hypothetical protein H7Y42_02285 [Chitinophagaceae bacterium]|nr:hypothetical protein [Chitinophagaceae bacterium]
MTMSKSLILALSLLWLHSTVLAQAVFTSVKATAEVNASCTPPKNREIFHDYIHAQQQKILQSDGIKDKAYTPSSNEEINLVLTKAATTTISDLECRIESDTTLNHQNKVRYLRGIENVLKFFVTNIRSKKVKPVHLPEIIATYEASMNLDKKGLSLATLINPLSYEVAYSITESDRVTFERNEGFAQAREMVLLKYCRLHPEQTFLLLKDNPNVSFADSLVRAVARKYPGQLYNYVQANNKLGVLIRNIRDDVFITSVSRMARSKSGQQYFPFLDNIVNGSMSIEQIDSIENDSIQYYKMLVQTQMSYTKRMLNRDTAFAYKELAAKLEKKAKDEFINTINGLHSEPDAVRFSSIQSLTAEELYYLAVMTDGLIYTSSYTKGIYPLMMKKIGQRGDSLLLSLHFDRYRKFISQAAAFNTLSSFLSTFPGHEDAAILMKAFVGQLEKSDGLEDGVDVADSYASIIESNPKLAADVLSLVKQNYQRNVESNNARGKNIYNILYQLFLSADSTKKVDLTKELGIPPVYTVPNSALTDTSGQVVMQMFFYGDEDGMLDYNIFQGMFNNANWKIDKTNKQWVTVRSVKGKSVTIYANVPFDEETGEDDKAQQALGDYFEKNDIRPTVTINRGHSYHAETTIGYMAPTSRIVFMGSCGGFHLIDAILQKSADAHIIASKQIGKRDINRPFLQLLTEKLRAGQDIDWISFWHEFKNNARVEGFEDYIPPYKNLGAIFIKAYKRAMGED